MNKPLNSPTTERIMGLDPRALLARRDTGERLRAWLPPEPDEIAALFPQYEILEIIGRGGMGAVYRARQSSLNRLVAIKLLPPEAAADSVFAERFRNEARVLARLQHPHIVAIHETGQTAQGHLFIVMEFVSGLDLAQLLAKGPLPPARALGIARAVCEALEFAHQQGVVHRDIKPANVLLSDDGAVKVADFGVARVRAETDETRLTFTGLALGTPDYMAPEQRQGGDVDGRADLFSLGVMLYEMLTGELPRGAWQPPSRKAPSGAHLDAVVEKAMQPDPARRPRNATELRASLTQGASSRNKLRWMLAGVAALILAGVIAWAVRPPQGGSAPSMTAAGTHTPLASLQLARDVLFGYWRWLDDQPGGTLVTDYAEAKNLRAVRLPFAPGGRAFDLHCEMLIEHKGADLSILFPAGNAWPGLTLDLYDKSGLELIQGLEFSKNASSVHGALPHGRFLVLHLRVRPQGERVTISVTLDGRPFIQWEGLQKDLTPYGDFARRKPISEARAHLILASAHGGVRVREARVEILAEKK
jgi:Protein kinase domain